MVERWFVGIDLGGAGTRAALATADGEVVAIGSGGPSGTQGGAAGRRHIQRALAAALAPIAPRVVGLPCSVQVGLRGLSIPGRREAVAVELGVRLPGAELKVSNDATIALWGGLGGADGVAVVAGTGSIALARSMDGHQARAGGYGYLVGDEGSGFWLGREAVVACLRALDGRAAPTLLRERVCEATGQRTPQELVAWLYGGQAQVTRLAALAPLVSRAAEDGDPTARDIIDRAAQALADLAIAAARQVWPPPAAAPDPLRVVCCGGVWSAGAVLQRPFGSILRKAYPAASVQRARLPPVGGAVLLAMGADNAPVSNTVVARLAQLSF